jgi:hypothetical protein
MPDPVEMTYYAGIALGCLLLLAVVAVYFVNRKLDLGGIVLTIFGFSLLGLPIWKALDLNPRRGEMHVELRVFERQTSSSANSTPNIKRSVINSLRYKVSIVNRSKTVSNKDIEPVVAALQRQVNEHLSPVWGISADLSIISEGSEIPTDSWELLILDDSDQVAAIGYHVVGPSGLPIGKVFAATAKSNGTSWSKVASHELLNMLLDPRVNSTIFIDINAKEGRLYTQEIASPCQDEKDGYDIDGVKVSDFVFPSWFEPNARPGTTQFDFTKHVEKPFWICPGGYINVYDIKGGEWQTKTGGSP